jgi:erythromycin esterase
MHFSGIAMEVSMPDASRVNDYVLRGVGDPEKLVHDRLGYWDAWDTEEILAIIQWLRRYNVDSAHGHKVRFYGFDMMFPASAVEEVIEFIEQIDGKRAVTFRENTVRVRSEPKSLSREEWTHLQAALGDLKTDFEAHRREYSSRSSPDALAWALQQIRVANQATSWWLARAGGDDNRADVRERGMARNIEWILENEGPRGRIFVSAHNAHVAKGNRSKPEGATLGAPIVPMGRYLYQILGNSLLVMAATFNRGGFEAVGPFKERNFGPALADSVDGELSRLRIPFLILDLRSLPDTVRRDLGRERLLRANVASGDDGYDAYTPTESFDAVYFIERVSRSRPNPLVLEAWRNQR